MSYNYISVAEDNEIIDAFSRVIKKDSTNPEIQLKMADVELLPHWELVGAIKNQQELFIELVIVRGKDEVRNLDGVGDSFQETILMVFTNKNTILQILSENY
jgi:hypothetical protein